MVPPAASIRSMVMLSGLGAFPFFYCLTASSTSHGSTSGKSGDQCCTYGSGGSGSGRFRWVESFKEFLCSVNNSAPVYCQRAFLLLNSCKLKLSAAEFFSLPCYWLRVHGGERNNFFGKIQLVGQKYRDKTILASKTRFSRHCFDFQNRRFSLLVGYST